MLKNTEMIAMLLAGGQGSRLYTLTTSLAKPAIPYGDKYRVIDFSLSNCKNSGINTVGVLTQYKPLSLSQHIGKGKPWNLEAPYGELQLLDSSQNRKKHGWYKGTANAVYQNIDYMEEHNPKYVIILSGDHVYKMDYSKMLMFHKEKNAACTISVKNVPLYEAHRFGILGTLQDHSIYQFDEKPKKPKSTKASMGIYIFNLEVLKHYLKLDADDPTSTGDFGKDILPNMLKAKEKMFAYEFNGYWQDIGTVESLWKANMDLLGPYSSFVPDDTDWPIYSTKNNLSPGFISKSAIIKNALIADGCNIYGQVYSSVISERVYIAAKSTVKNSVIMPGAIIDDEAIIQNAIVAPNAVICSGAIVGTPLGNINFQNLCEITAVPEDATIRPILNISTKSEVNQSRQVAAL